MFPKLLSTGLLLCLLGQTTAQAASDEQLAAIRELGRLNGIALQCNALPETQRMKRALVANLPKRRQLGELFDYETNQSFMAFIQTQASCPDPQSLSRQVDEQLIQLETVFKNP
jgi:hypothetical protein